MRRIAPGAGFELLTTGDFLSAPRAHAMGVVNRLAPPDRLAEETRALAAQIAADLVTAGHRVGVYKPAASGCQLARCTCTTASTTRWRCASSTNHMVQSLTNTASAPAVPL